MASVGEHRDEFAAPSTASFGGSTEEQSEDVHVNASKHIVVPAPTLAPDLLGGCKPVKEDPSEQRVQTRDARNMADMIGNAAASSGVSPLSYEQVVLTP